MGFFAVQSELQRIPVSPTNQKSRARTKRWLRGRRVRKVPLGEYEVGTEERVGTGRLGEYDSRGGRRPA